MKRVGIYEAKTRFSALLREVSNGETIIITHRGDDVAEIVRPKNDAATAIDNLTSNQMSLGVSIREAIDEGRR